MKRQLHLAIGLFLFASTALKSQPAPNFTLTDSDGQSHNLYTDYLDQGKTVVIKFFFTTCPPCNAMAPADGAVLPGMGRRRPRCGVHQSQHHEF
ncbi:MAG: redoxin domain-containing protein [Saprospiraceae bacterium]|nr:redoxin domain-containing protein [Saprospiraceae bacterium]